MKKQNVPQICFDFLPDWMSFQCLLCFCPVIVSKSSCIKILLAEMPSVFNFKKVLFYHFNPWWAESVPAAWARQQSGSGSVYSSADSEYGTATLSQFHPCKPGNLPWRHDGVQKLQCWQKRSLPFFLPCVALLDTLPGWGLKPVESWPGRKSYNLPWLSVPQQRCFVVWEHDARQARVGDAGDESFCGWRIWLWWIMWKQGGDCCSFELALMLRSSLLAVCTSSNYKTCVLWQPDSLAHGASGRIIRGIIISTSVGLNPDLWPVKVAHLLGSRGVQEFKDRGLEKTFHLS